MTADGRWVRRVVAVVAAVSGTAALLLALHGHGGPHRTEPAGIRPLSGAVAAIDGGHYLLLAAGLVLLLVVRVLLVGHRAAWLAAVVALATGALGATELHRPIAVLAALVLTAGVAATAGAFPASGDPLQVRRGVGVLLGGTSIVAVFGAVGLHRAGQGFGRGTSFTGSVAGAVRLLLMLPAGTGPLPPHAAWLVPAVRGAELLVVLVGAGLVVAAVTGQRQRPADRRVVERLLAEHGETPLVHFHLLPDKQWLITPDQRAFVSYGLRGRIAVALGGPVGAPDARRDAAAAFLALCRRNGWTPAFHQVSEAELAPLRELGLQAYKIGETAVVDPATAELAGRALKQVRSAVRRCERAGLRVVELPHPLTDADLARLREVSDEWSASGGHRERTFTLGQFDADQLRATPVLAVVDAEDRVQAFLNLLPRYQGPELTFDLMRRRPDAVNGVMEQLYVAVLERAAREGATGVDLGLAPFSGLAGQPGVPARVMQLLYDRGGALLNYAGLRTFKDKWAPRWEPRYLVTTGDAALARVAVAVARLGELPDPRSPGRRVLAQVRRRPVTALFLGLMLWLELASAYDPAVHRQLLAAAGSSWELLTRGQLWRLVTSPVVQSSPGLAWLNLLLGLTAFSLAEARWGSRWTAVGFFAGDLIGSIPVLLAVRVLAGLGSPAAQAELHALDGGSSAGTWALLAAVAWSLPTGRWRRAGVGLVAVVLLTTLGIRPDLANVQHLASASGMLALLAARARWTASRRRAAAAHEPAEEGQRRVEAVTVKAGSRAT